jgi:hypothetical protein
MDRNARSLNCRPRVSSPRQTGDEIGAAAPKIGIATDNLHVNGVTALTPMVPNCPVAPLFFRQATDRGDQPWRFSFGDFRAFLISGHKPGNYTRTVC